MFPGDGVSTLICELAKQAPTLPLALVRLQTIRRHLYWRNPRPIRRSSPRPNRLVSVRQLVAQMGRSELDRGGVVSR
jgi:hypothetical protein